MRRASCSCSSCSGVGPFLASLLDDPPRTQVLNLSFSPPFFFPTALEEAAPSELTTVASLFSGFTSFFSVPTALGSTETLERASPVEPASTPIWTSEGGTSLRRGSFVSSSIPLLEHESRSSTIIAVTIIVLAAIKVTARLYTWALIFYNTVVRVVAETLSSHRGGLKHFVQRSRALCVISTFRLLMCNEAGKRWAWIVDAVYMD